MSRLHPQIKMPTPSRDNNPHGQCCAECKYWIQSGLEIPDCQDNDLIHVGGVCRKRAPAPHFANSLCEDWCAEFEQTTDSRPPIMSRRVDKTIRESALRCDYYPTQDYGAPDPGGAAIAKVLDEVRQCETRIIRDLHNRPPEKKPRERARIFGLLVDHIIVGVVVAGVSLLVGLVRLQTDRPAADPSVMFEPTNAVHVLVPHERIP